LAKDSASEYLNVFPAIAAGVVKSGAVSPTSRAAKHGETQSGNVNNSAIVRVIVCSNEI